MFWYLISLMNVMTVTYQTFVGHNWLALACGVVALPISMVLTMRRIGNDR